MSSTRPPTDPATPIVDAVVIGRNEGTRLLAGLDALCGQVRRVIYVDSGSTDGSPVAAQEAGAIVVALDMDQPFTAARARNAGLTALLADPPEFVQVIDGDCAVDPGWIEAALTAFAAHPKAAVICGRRRERHPQASVYNAMADAEWDTPLGLATACGGDALMRYGAVMDIGGYRADLIAGEEPEMCLRLRAAGAEVWRIDAEMTLHDAAMTRFSQWWRRMVRSGHAFAEGTAIHGPGHWGAETRRALLWGAVLPLVAVMAGVLHPAGWLLALAYPAQIIRLAARDGFGRRAWVWSAYTVIGRFAEARGALGFYANRVMGRRRGLIEYK